MFNTLKYSIVWNAFNIGSRTFHITLINRCTEVCNLNRDDVNLPADIFLYLPVFWQIIHYWGRFDIQTNFYHKMPRENLTAAR